MGGYLESSRSFERGVFKMFTSCSQGGGGCKKFQNCVHVVCEWPLIADDNYISIDDIKMMYLQREVKTN